MEFNTLPKPKLPQNKEEALLLAQSFLSILTQEKSINVEKAIVFGSYINGRNHAYSDIDIALWSKDFTGVSFLDVKLFSTIKYANPQFYTIECHCFLPSQQHNSFEEEIEKTGLALRFP